MERTPGGWVSFVREERGLNFPVNKVLAQLIASLLTVISPRRELNDLPKFQPSRFLFFSQSKGICEAQSYP